jgi:hypothetical protein
MVFGQTKKKRNQGMTNRMPYSPYGIRRRSEPIRYLRYWTIDYPYLGSGGECHPLLPVARDSECHRMLTEYKTDLYTYFRGVQQETGQW